jgi:polyhydroxybutyrate depolymerase
VELDCDDGNEIPPGLCESDDRPAGDAGVDETCSRKAPLSPGSYERTAADERTYQFYIPESLDTSQKVPLVFVHHGFAMSGENMKTLTSWTQIADEEGIVVVFPDGGGFAPWNVGEKTVCSVGEVVNDSTQDDFGFVENMIESIDQSVCVDRTKVFTTGFSMGGYFTNNIACHRPNLVRAVAPHSGGMEIDAQCADPRPVLILHGTADPLISYDCGLDARDQWARFNGCSTEVDTEQVTRGICERNRDCPDDAQVEMCSFDEMGHGWAGSDITHGGGSEYEDAARLIWRFFQEQM